MKIANKVKMAVGILAVGAMQLSVITPVNAIKCLDGTEVEDISKCGYAPDGQKDVDVNSFGKTLISVFLGIIGFLSVIMIIYGGFLYTTSAGDSSKVTKAKNTIMYGIIGLIIALLAFAIVNFVLNGLFSK